MNEKSKQRAKLSLRSERAMGLPSVKAPKRQSSSRNRQSTAAAPASITSAPIKSAPVKHAPITQAPLSTPRAREAVPPPRLAAAVPPALQFESTPFTSPLLPREKRITELRILDEKHVSVCTKCRLSETRTRTVFGEGDVQAKIFFIGEGPGETEDQTGRPFVGRAGQLLDKMIVAMGLQREMVYIANIVKCRPPENRVPMTDEINACTPYLLQQIETVRPQVIVTLGRPSTSFLLNSTASMGSLRGRWHEWRGIKVMPTYHPSYVLRSYTPEVRAAVWSDLKMVLTELGLKVPSRSSQ